MNANPPINFPDLIVQIESSLDLSFTDADEILNGVGAQAQLREIANKTMKQREKFCKGRPWWDCSESATLGECAFVNGQCKGAPVDIQPERYFEKWKRLYTPIYAKIPKPEVDENGNLVVPTAAPRRKKSTRRQRGIIV